MIEKRVQKEAKIFISHRSLERRLINELVQLLENFGFDRDNIFYSSNYDTGVKAEIKKEVKANLRSCNFFIVLLSNAYYGSPYCTNELGAIWVSNKKFFLFGLDEITKENMQGFIDNDNLLHRLNNRKHVSLLLDELKLQQKNARTDEYFERYSEAINREIKTLTAVKSKLVHTTIPHDKCFLIAKKEIARTNTEELATTFKENAVAVRIPIESYDAIYERLSMAAKKELRDLSDNAAKVLYYLATRNSNKVVSRYMTEDEYRTIKKWVKVKNEGINLMLSEEEYSDGVCELIETNMVREVPLGLSMDGIELVNNGKMSEEDIEFLRLRSNGL